MNAVAAWLGGLGFDRYATVFAEQAVDIDVLPDLNRDNITVLVDAPQLAPEEIESQIVRSVETALHGVSGVQHVRSVCGAGFASVRAELNWRADNARSSAS